MNETICANCDFHRQLYIGGTPTDYHICRLKGLEPINPQDYCEKYVPKTEKVEEFQKICDTHSCEHCPIIETCEFIHPNKKEENK